MSNKRHIRLKDARSGKKLIAQLVNKVLRNEISSQKAKDIGYLIKLFIEVHELEDLESRLLALEKLTNENQKEI